MKCLTTLLCAAALVGLGVERAAIKVDDTLETLLHFRECPLNVELEAVYERPAKIDDRFVRVSVKERPQNFVQCMVAGSAVICEASAFHGGAEANKTPLPAQSVAALEKLGFAVAPVGKNLTYRRAFSGKPDFDAVAVLMLTALHEAYGVNADTDLDTYAPFAGNVVTACRY